MIEYNRIARYKDDEFSEITWDEFVEEFRDGNDTDWDKAKEDLENSVVIESNGVMYAKAVPILTKFLKKYSYYINLVVDLDTPDEIKELEDSLNNTLKGMGITHTCRIGVQTGNRIGTLTTQNELSDRELGQLEGIVWGVFSGYIKIDFKIQIKPAQ